MISVVRELTDLDKISFRILTYDLFDLPRFAKHRQFTDGTGRFQYDVHGSFRRNRPRCFSLSKYTAVTLCRRYEAGLSPVVHDLFLVLV